MELTINQIKLAVEQLKNQRVKPLNVDSKSCYAMKTATGISGIPRNIFKKDSGWICLTGTEKVLP